MTTHQVNALPPHQYLDALRSIAGLYLHIATYSGNGREPKRTTRRAVAAPPRDAACRAALLTRAATLLDLSQDAASDRLANELDHVQPLEGLRPWLKDHTRSTPTTTPLLDEVVQRRASIGRRRVPKRINHPHVPQLIWPNTWTDIRSMLTTSEPTGRAFASMLLIKSQDDLTWRQAANLLDLPTTLGHNIARTGARSLTTSTHRLIDTLLRHADHHADQPVNYRKREHVAEHALSTPTALRELRSHLHTPHLRELLLRERTWTLWALGHPALVTNAHDANLEKARAATQRRRWTPDSTQRLLEWCDARHRQSNDSA